MVEPLIRYRGAGPQYLSRRRFKGLSWNQTATLALVGFIIFSLITVVKVGALVEDVVVAQSLAGLGKYSSYKTKFHQTAHPSNLPCILSSGHPCWNTNTLCAGAGTRGGGRSQ